MVEIGAANAADVAAGAQVGEDPVDFAAECDVAGAVVGCAGEDSAGAAADADVLDGADVEEEGSLHQEFDAAIEVEVSVEVDACWRDG